MYEDNKYECIIRIDVSNTFLFSDSYAAGRVWDFVPDEEIFLPLTI